MPPGDRPACDYSVTVSRAAERPVAGFWSIGLRDPLPSLPIPLRPPHADAVLDLQALLRRVYDAAGYAHSIHDGSPSPPPSAGDAAWPRTLLPPSGR